MISDLLAPLFSTDEMRAVFADEARIRAMLAFEAALAEAESAAGVIPAEAAGAIAEACRTFRPDIPGLGAATRNQATPAIPLVKALTAHCGEAGRSWVHWGATSQDVIDTGLVLQMRDGLALLEADLVALGDSLAARAEEHRATVMAGRTLLQPALPVTFGFKCAGWLDALIACRTGLKRAANEAIVLQFGGAVGTLSALGGAAADVRQALGRCLDLPVPDIAWHASRGRLVRLCSELAILCGALSKIAGDVALMMQAEVAEAFEPKEPGRGGSSTMPQKRNPVAALAVRANAIRANGLVASLFAAMDHEHERGAGGWHVEWTTVPELFELTAGSLRHVRETVAGLEIDAMRMRANLDIGYGTLMSEALMMALAPHIGRGEAHHLVAELARASLAESRPLAEIAAADARVATHLDGRAVERALEPSGYLGTSESGIATVVARWRDITSNEKGDTGAGNRR